MAKISVTTTDKSKSLASLFRKMDKLCKALNTANAEAHKLAEQNGLVARDVFTLGVSNKRLTKVMNAQKKAEYNEMVARVVLSHFPNASRQ